MDSLFSDLVHYGRVTVKVSFWSGYAPKSLTGLEASASELKELLSTKWWRGRDFLHCVSGDLQRRPRPGAKGPVPTRA
jgi:hypothetical protein